MTVQSTIDFPRLVCMVKRNYSVKTLQILKDNGFFDSEEQFLSLPENRTGLVILSGMDSDEYLSLCTALQHLSDIVYPENRQKTVSSLVCTIPCEAYKDDDDITKVIISPETNKIGIGAFCGCESLISVDTTNAIHLNTIEVRAFSYCKSLSDFDFPYNNVTIETHAFYNSGLNNLIIPAQTSVGSWCFAECRGLKSVIWNSDSEIPEYGFANDIQLKNVTIQGQPKIIKLGAFTRCESLEEIKIPPSVKVIEDIAFKDCKNLKIIYLPKSCSIAKNTFHECDAIKAYYTA